VDVREARGRLLDAHTLMVGDERITANKILVATGGWPFVPDIPGKEHAITSNEALDLEWRPPRILIVGGGYIAVEFAGIFAGLGSETTLVVRSKLLRGFDDDLGKELDGALGDRDPELADLERLELHRRVIEEALRLYPPVWSLFRKFPEARRVCGYDLPAGGTVVLCPYITHRDPRFWSDPDRFDPDRFDPAQVEARHRYAHFPFGGGPHVCIGATFARVEARMVLAMLLRRFTLEFTS
ncbi:MAG: cytochrome P450, partial [Myxococcales bacterium]|nr:cytochrome P450 [Myxococcales bacterium]